MFLPRELAKIGLFFPRFLMGSSIRSKLKCLAHSIPYWERDQFNNKPSVEPWAFMRVHNEIKMIKKSLPNIKKVIHRGVIATHGSTDGTDEYIEEFCKQNENFIFYRYPYHVFPANDERYKRDIPYENTLAAYYNATLNLIPQNEWLIKIDADMLCFPECLEKTFHMVQSEDDCLIYSRLDCIRTENNSWMISAYRRPGDQWLIKNKNLKFINKIFYDHGEFRAHEVLLKGKKRIISPECVWLHFPYEKEWRNNYQSIKLYNIDDFLQSIDNWEIDKNIFNKPNLLRIFQSID